MAANDDVPLKVAVVPVTPLQQNCSIVWSTADGRGVVVDPGGDIERIVSVAAELEVRIERILLTHGHFDHAGGAADLAEQLGIEIEGPHEGDRFLLDNLVNSAARFGIEGGRNVTPDRWLDEGDTVTIGSETLSVHHCPGHSPGHVVFFHKGARLAIVGDVLFNGSIGRTDLNGGDFQLLLTSITTKLWPMGEDVTFVPGHGAISTFGTERKLNPFVSDFAMSRGEY